MGNTTTQSLQNILSKAGVSSGHFEIKSCTTEGACQLRIQGDSPSQVKTTHAQDFFEKANRWIQKFPDQANSRNSLIKPLFHPLSPNWAWVDYDQDKEMDGILFYQKDKGWFFLNEEWKIGDPGKEVLDQLHVYKKLLQAANDEEITGHQGSYPIPYFFDFLLLFFLDFCLGYESGDG